MEPILKTVLLESPVAPALKKMNRARLRLSGRLHGRNVRIDGMILAKNRFGRYCIPADSVHRPASEALIDGKVWELETIAYMMDQAEEKDVVTAGAFFGDALPALSQAVGPSHKVWAFEPNPDNFRCASITLLLNDLQNVYLANAGLGAEPGSNRLIVRDFVGWPLGGASQIVGASMGDGKRGDTTVPVRIVTIDATVPEDRHVSIVQLDVEGFEEFALMGARKIIANSRPKLILETVPASGPGKDLLDELGYSITRRLDENFLLEC